MKGQKISAPQTGIRRRQAGFSLIEALIALLVMSLGLVALAKFQGTLVSNSAFSKTRSEAIGLAHQQMETLRNLNQTSEFAALTSGSDAPSGVTTTFTRTWTLTANAEGTAVYVDVVVGWSDPKEGAQTVTLSTILSNPMPVAAAQLFKEPVTQSGVVSVPTSATTTTTSTNTTTTVAGATTSSTSATTTTASATTTTVQTSYVCMCVYKVQTGLVVSGGGCCTDAICLTADPNYPNPKNNTSWQASCSTTASTPTTATTTTTAAPTTTTTTAAPTTTTTTAAPTTTTTTATPTTTTTSSAAPTTTTSTTTPPTTTTTTLTTYNCGCKILGGKVSVTSGTGCCSVQVCTDAPTASTTNKATWTTSCQQ